MSDGTDKWAKILEANPAMAEDGFADATAKWNALKGAADRMGLDESEAIAFVAFGMTGGEEGALPESVSADDVAAAIAAEDGLTP